MRKLELLVRIVNERAEVRLLLLGERVAEDVVNVLPYHARAVVQDVQERLVLAVQVAHEMLGALGQVEDCLQVDDLSEDGLLRGELLGKKTQVLEGLVGPTERIHGYSFPLAGRAFTPSLARDAADSRFVDVASELLGHAVHALAGGASRVPRRGAAGA